MNVIAILDIGKTNKKLFLIDEQYRIVWEKGERFPEIKDEDGDACEDVQQLTAWVRNSLRSMLQQEGFAVKAVNCSTYGASLVHVDEQGRPVTPLYNYLKPYPKELQQQFYNTYGGEVLLSGITASPSLGSLNSGLQLYRLRHRQPETFSRIRYSLHLPQYISYLITGRPLADITSIGCHTLLWNFPQQHYHEWVYREGIIGKLPPLFPCNEVMPVEVDGRSYVAGAGLHDSSAALIPYLASFTEPFALISTGTWCITLNPFNADPLTSDELQQDCLCYLSYQGRPVKASRLFAGNEHEQQVARLAEYYQTPVNYYQHVAFDPAIFARLLQAEAQQGAPAGAPSLQASRFAQRELAAFATYEEAYHRLMMDIMEQQRHSTRLVTENTPVKRIFVDGGFSRNPVYMHLLAAAFPRMEVYAASVAQATAIGAALAIHPHWNGSVLPGDLVEMRYYHVGL